MTALDTANIFRLSNVGLVVMFLGLALMRFVPGPEPGTVLFAIGALAVTGVHFTGTLVSPATGMDLLIRRLSYGLLLALISAAVLGVCAGHPISAIAKSAVPFLVLIWAISVLVPQIPCSLHLEKLLVLAASVWALRLIADGVLDFLSGTSFNWLRLTLVNADAVVPFPLIVIPLILFSSRPLPRLWRSIALVLQLVIVAWSGYRSQQMLVAVMLLLALGRMLVQRPLLGAIAMLMTTGTFSLIAFVIMNDPEASLLTAQLDRYVSLSDEREISGRALERRFALDRFLDYPILGAGLGVQVPSSITYASTEITEEYDLPETVSYLHNGPFFLMMTGGIPFLLAYLALWVVALLTTDRIWVKVALLALFAFIQVEATFLQVHFNVLLALLVGRQFSTPKSAQ